MKDLVIVSNDIVPVNNELVVFNNKLIKDSSIFLELPSEKIAILVNALRLVSNDYELKTREILIPDDCEKYGFSEGNHNFHNFFHFLADMLEE